MTVAHACDESGTRPRQTPLEKETMIRNERNSNRTDAELVHLTTDGSEAAFEEIYRRHRSFVYSIAFRMTGNAADAEDLTQESFVVVWRRIGSFRGEALFTTWLYRLVTNQVNMHFRYRNSRPEMQTTDGEIPERGPDRYAGTAQPLIDRLAIEEAVRMLPVGYRTAFIRHDVQGYKHEEAARLSGYTAGTSKSQLHRARGHLRALLGRAPAFQN
jgi:RNA polymerase sigma-70 factor (ECF subfamily)